MNKIDHLSWHDGVELLDIKIQGHPFGKHSHDAYAIGVMEQGVGGNIYKGEKYTLPTGMLSLMNPDVPHDGFSVSESLKYKTLYVSERSMQDILGHGAAYRFQEYVACDVGGMVASMLNDIQLRLEKKNHAGWRLAIDSEVTCLLEMIMSRYAKSQSENKGKEPLAVKVVKDYLDSLTTRVIGAQKEHPGEAITLGVLARMVGLNSNYLLNTFTEHVGVSPYAYWVVRRIRVAKRLLGKGWGISSVAAELGFYDQAHFSRAFKRHTGVTPGKFVKQL